MGDTSESLYSGVFTPIHTGVPAFTSMYERISSCKELCLQHYTFSNHLYPPQLCTINTSTEGVGVH